VKHGLQENHAMVLLMRAVMTQRLDG
jgi:hypothetical protein